jgi:FdhD protein
LSYGRVMKPIDDPRIADVEIRRSGDLARTDRDRVAVEEPLEIRLAVTRNGEEREQSISITMRTPGHDRELAVGFLHGEGIIGGREDLRDLELDTAEQPDCNVVSLRLTEAARFDPRSLERHFYTTSSCGVCGKQSLAALRELSDPELAPDAPVLNAEVISQLPARLREAQSAFDETGGLHAAGIFAVDGTLLCVREDVGRHNAVDKAIGRQVLDGRTPLRDSILMVSGRTSFEILQKALVAEIPIVVAVSAPSSLAVDVARNFGMTLLGFVRGDSFNVYADPGRLRGRREPGA